MLTTFRSTLSHLKRSALDLILPTRCLGCRREGDLLCPPCIAGTTQLAEPYCRICADPGVAGLCRRCRQAAPACDGIRAPYLMEGAVRRGIHSLKYRNVRAAAMPLAQLLADYLADNPVPGEVIVPAPLHQRRLRERGYNQAGLMARELGKLTGLPVNENLLIRARETLPQVRTTTVQQRRENLAGAFVCLEPAAGQAILLVDDVATTGSTLSAGAAALKEAGAASVWGLTIAREGRAYPGPSAVEPPP